MNWEKCVFHWGKWYFEPIVNCVYTTAFRKDLDNTLTPLCPNVISTQAETLVQKKMKLNKVHSFKKWVLSFQTLNSRF